MVFPTTQTSAAERRSPIDGAKEGHLLLGHGAAAHAILAGSDDVDGILSARFRGEEPSIVAEAGRIEMRYPVMRLPRPWLMFRPFGADLKLNAKVPWTIELTGGVSQSRFDLRALDLRGFSSRGGLSRADVILPKPRGIVHVRITGGVSRLRVERPRGVAARVGITGGATRIALDEARFGAVGGELRWTTPFASEAADRYEIQVTGGVSTLDLAEVG